LIAFVREQKLVIPFAQKRIFPQFPTILPRSIKPATMKALHEVKPFVGEIAVSDSHVIREIG